MSNELPDPDVDKEMDGDGIAIETIRYIGNLPTSHPKFKDRAIGVVAQKIRMYRLPNHSLMKTKAVGNELMGRGYRAQLHFSPEQLALLQ